MKSLDGTTSGVYKVYTETSSYIINLNRNIAKRLPGDGKGASPASKPDAVLTTLRADNQWFELRSVYAVVGQVMHLECQGIAEGDTYTWRKTTIVREIEKIDGRKKV